MWKDTENMTTDGGQKIKKNIGCTIYRLKDRKEKKKYGTKHNLLKKYIKEPGRFERRYFSAFLNKLDALKPEERPTDITGRGKRDYRVRKQVSSPTLEESLRGNRKWLDLPGKKGSFIDLAHGTAKTGELTLGDFNYMNRVLNEQLGLSGANPELFRNQLEKHISDVASKYKNKKVYTINANKNSIDQLRFKKVLERKFGKSTGDIPLERYINEVLNEEARLMGQTTDGLITARTLDTKTFTLQDPIGKRITTLGLNDPDLAKMSMKDIYKGIKSGDKVLLQRFQKAANESFQTALLNSKKNLSIKNVEAVVNNIKKNV